MPLNNCLRTKRDHRIQPSLNLGLGLAQEGVASGLLRVRTPADPRQGEVSPDLDCPFPCMFQVQENLRKNLFSHNTD